MACARGGWEGKVHRARFTVRVEPQRKTPPRGGLNTARGKAIRHAVAATPGFDTPKHPVPRTGCVQPRSPGDSPTPGQLQVSKDRPSAVGIVGVRWSANGARAFLPAFSPARRVKNPPSVACARRGWEGKVHRARFTARIAPPRKTPPRGDLNTARGQAIRNAVAATPGPDTPKHPAPRTGCVQPRSPGDSPTPGQVQVSKDRPSVVGNVGVRWPANGARAFLPAFSPARRVENPPSVASARGGWEGKVRRGEQRTPIWASNKWPPNMK